MLEKVFWNELALPARKTLAQVMYALRYDDRDDQLLLDSVTREDVLFEADEIYDATLDALEVQFSQMDRKMAIMQRVMNNVSPTLQVLNYQITPPFKRQGTVQIAAIFELSDLQTITIFFHNPDADPKKLAPTDTLLSWKWLLNKKDVTIVVAPEKGKDLNVREVGRRIMKLADKNSAAFAKANAKKEERAKQIAEMQEANAEKVRQIEALEKELNELNTEISGLKDQVSTAKKDLATAQREAERKAEEIRAATRAMANVIKAADQRTKEARRQAQMNKKLLDDHFVFVGAGSDQVKKAVENKLGITEPEPTPTITEPETASENSDQNVVAEPSDNQEPPKAKNAEELKELLVESLNQKKDIHNAFRREDVDGPIDILYRYVKDKKNGNPGRVSGVEHIIESRTADGTLNHVTVEQLFSDIAKAIELGEKHIQAKRPDYERIKLSYGEAEAVLVKDGAMNAYVLTGWNISKERLAELNSVLSGERGAAHFNPPPTHDDPTISRIKVGADSGNSNPIDNEKQEAISYLNSVIDGTLPTLVENSTGDKLEELYNKYSSDSEMEALITKAIDEWGKAVYAFTNKQGAA